MTVRKCGQGPVRIIYVARQKGENRLELFSFLLSTDAETLQAFAILVVALGLAGLAILILFAKRKI